MNKNCICFCLYDNNNLSDTNLYYYTGIIYNLMFKNRNYDIIIDCTHNCYKILLDIIKQENLNIGGVEFILHENNCDSRGMLWRIKSFLNKCHLYNKILLLDSDIDLIFNNFNFDDKYAVYSPIYFNEHMNIGNCWGSFQYFCGGNTYFCVKNFKTDIKKIYNVVDQLLYYKNIKVAYEFDEFLLTSLLYKEILYNNYSYYTFNTNYNNNYLKNNTNILYLKNRDNYVFKIKNTLKYYKDGYYYLNSKKLLWNSYIKNTNVCNDILQININKNLFTNIIKYILDYTDKIDLKKYDMVYEKIKK